MEFDIVIINKHISLSFSLNKMEVARIRGKKRRFISYQDGVFYSSERLSVSTIHPSWVDFLMEETIEPQDNTSVKVMDKKTQQRSKEEVS